MSEEATCEFDELKMYFGEDYKISDKIVIHQPTIGEIVEFGDKRMYAAMAPLLSNTTSYRLQLWDMGVDWNKITDFELFIMLTPTMTQENTSIVFGDFDFSKLKPYQDNETGEVALYDENMDKVIDEATYTLMSEYVRTMFNQHPKVEKAKGKTTKLAIIDEDRMNLRMQERLHKNDGNKSILLPLISSMLNYAGFKYKKQELKEVGIVEFMDSVQRAQIFESVTALMHGMYSGMIDTSKINTKKELNWLRSLDED